MTLETQALGNDWPASDSSTSMAPSEPSALDRVLTRLRERAQSFARTSPAEKARLLSEVRARFFQLSPNMVDLGVRAKGVDANSPLAGEEWFSGPNISLRALRLFERSLRDVDQFGAPRIEPGNVRTGSDGRTEVVLLPHETYDRMLFRKWHGVARLEAEHVPGRISDIQAGFYRKAEPEGRVVLVLGAGNVGSISVLDVLHHSFVEGAVCLLKMSPVNDYLGPLFERAFAPLVDAGFLDFAYGGADVGAYLCAHPLVDGIHVTGSVETHDSIVWGPRGAARTERRRTGQPLTGKRVTSELGNVSPVLVVPAKYSDRELSAAARSIAGMVVHNASYNCNAAKMIVTARDWAQQDQFLTRVRHVLAEVPARAAYYPGAAERYQRLVEQANEGRVERIGSAASGELPWTLISDLDPGGESALFRTEPFCPIVSQTAVPTGDAAQFLSLATRFANERLWGTLNALIIAPDSVRTDPALADSLTQAVHALRYGTVSVNVWPAVGYGLGIPPWGGFPRATLSDVQSGIGWGHNALFLDGVEQVVLEGPLLLTPEPFWYPGHRRLRELGVALAAVEARQSGYGVAKAAWAAVRR